MEKKKHNMHNHGCVSLSVAPNSQAESWPLSLDTVQSWVHLEFLSSVGLGRRYDILV